MKSALTERDENRAQLESILVASFPHLYSFGIEECFDKGEAYRELDEQLTALKERKRQFLELFAKLDIDPGISLLSTKLSLSHTDRNVKYH